MFCLNVVFLLPCHDFPVYVRKIYITTKQSITNDFISTMQVLRLIEVGDMGSLQSLLSILEENGQYLAPETRSTAEAAIKLRLALQLQRCSATLKLALGSAIGAVRDSCK